MRPRRPRPRRRTSRRWLPSRRRRRARPRPGGRPPRRPPAAPTPAPGRRAGRRPRAPAARRPSGPASEPARRGSRHSPYRASHRARSSPCWPTYGTPSAYATTWSSGLAGWPSTTEYATSSSAGKKGETVAPDAATAPVIRPRLSRTGIPPAPGNAASGDTATKPAAIAGGRVVIRCRCSVEGIFWVAAIQAFDLARPSPPAPPSSIRDAVTRAPEAPTTAMAPEMPSCSALSIPRRTSSRASSSEMSVMRRPC